MDKVCRSLIGEWQTLFTCLLDAGMQAVLEL